MNFAYSEVLEPQFCIDLIRAAGRHDESQSRADADKRHIAALVSDMWDEYKTMRDVFPTRLDYFAECSRVLNAERKKIYFSASGETLRRWVELYETFKVFFDKVENADFFYEIATQDHLKNARQIWKAGKVNQPFLALQWAFPLTGEKRSADEMLEHFLPNLPPDEWGVMVDRVQAMKSKDFWKLKNKENVKRILEHVTAIENILREDRPNIEMVTK